MDIERTVELPSSAAVSCFSDLAKPFGTFDGAMNVMEILADNGQGLGEVLRDYAEQIHAQMSKFFHAVNQLVNGIADADDMETLTSTYFVLTSAATVLDMAPAAMLRNHAEMLGGKEKVSREQIARITRAFRQAPEVMALMQSEEATHQLLISAVTIYNKTEKPPLLSTTLTPRTEARN